MQTIREPLRTPRRPLGGVEFVNRQFALAEMISLFASFDETGAIGRGEFYPVLNYGELLLTSYVLRVA